MYVFIYSLSGRSILIHYVVTVDRVKQYLFTDCGEHFTLRWGGHFSLRTDSCPHGDVIDCVWVLYRYPLPAYSDYIWLSIYDLKLELGELI